MELSTKEMFAGRVSATLILPYVYDLVNYTIDMYGGGIPSMGIYEMVDMKTGEEIEKISPKVVRTQRDEYCFSPCRRAAEQRAQE